MVLPSSTFPRSTFAENDVSGTGLSDASKKGQTWNAGGQRQNTKKHKRNLIKILENHILISPI